MREQRKLEALRAVARSRDRQTAAGVLVVMMVLACFLVLMLKPGGAWAVTASFTKVAAAFETADMNLDEESDDGEEPAFVETLAPGCVVNPRVQRICRRKHFADGVLSLSNARDYWNCICP